MTLDPTIPRWPATLLTPDAGLGPVSGGAIGPEPFEGAPQIVVAPSAYLSFHIPKLSLYDNLTDRSKTGRVHAYRAMYHGVLQQGGAVYMPLHDWPRSPRVRAGLPIFVTVTHSDDTTFSDGAPYAQSPGDAFAALRAEKSAWELMATIVTAIAPEAGDIFSIGEWAYVIARSYDETPSGQTTPRLLRLVVDRPLRVAVAAGEELDFAGPICKMRLHPKSRSQAAMLTSLRSGSVDLEFIEARAP